MLGFAFSGQSFLSPTRWIERLLRQKMKWYGMQNHLHRLTTGEGQLEYWQGGSGPPLLLLHGFGATALWQWHTQVPELMQNYQLIIPNLMGFGRSIPKGKERSLDFQAQTISKLMAHLGIENFHLLGMSYGGFVANRLVINHPSCVDKLILVDSPGGVMTKDDYQAILNRFQLNRIHDLLLPNDPQGVERLMKIAWHRRFRVPTFALRDAYSVLFSVQTEIKLELIDSLLLWLENPPSENRHIKHQTLLIWGEFDPLFPILLAEKMKASLNATLHILEKTAHAPNLERPKAFNKLVLEFLSGS